MRPTLRQLQYLVATADTGRFSDAAERLHVSQPSLSAQIAEAESHLGAIVFERGRHGARMTPLGAEIVRRARYVLRQMEDMQSIAKSGGLGLYGRVRMGVLPTIGPYLLPRATGALHREFPELRLSIREESTVELQDKLTDGQMDVLISTPEDHSPTDSAHLFRESLWVAVPSDDPLAAEAGPLDLDQLAGRPVLTLGMGHRLTSLVSELAHAAGAFVSTDYEGTSLDAIRHMAALGAGVAVLPQLYVTCEARRDDVLVYRRIDTPMAERNIALVWRQGSPLTDGLQQLADALRTAASTILDEV
ncbi:LysR substrate-binding domain-containing protein [Maricaulis sp.]|jgi:LysR family transcriptional regulator, hydrogen peroxide-inducible genes activator|uniref:LysR substrate-binding domain-containing protein n=1 Tax=Maricaulis sp. TaxID=1486257 RepID=UPI002633D709|nr:LysR substrate-binding domain-containing protein [Maricaulis sp.]MDF1768896.1 LysR substrate-binding domain-containing protein [Maricaulis sp.]